MNFGLFENHIMDRFDFSKEYVGYVIDNSEFEEKFTIKVFIPELFGYNYEEFVQSRNNPTETITNVDSGIKELSILNDNIINREELNISTTIQSSDYITARILIDRHSFKSLEDFIFDNKPDLGKKVLVKFLNENPLNCIYTNTLFLGDNEDPYLYIKDDGSIGEDSSIGGNKTSTNGESKIYWYVRK